MKNHEEIKALHKAMKALSLYEEKYDVWCRVEEEIKDNKIIVEGDYSSMSISYNSIKEVYEIDQYDECGTHNELIVKKSIIDTARYVLLVCGYEF